MPKEKTKKKLCVDDIRHSEYYDMQDKFDELYKESKEGKSFTNLTDIIFSKNNILLAYRNIKNNSGSLTPGTDGKDISDIGKLEPDVVVENVRQYIDSNGHGYRPKPVRRVEIPKPNGSTRPLGIPCIWDRLIQQCIKQVMEPICEARFSENSYGFRPNRSVENAISKTYKLMQISNLHYVVEFDIKGFFDNVNHSKLIKKIWSIGIRDRKLIYLLKKILKAPIKHNNGKVIYPEKGTPQGGIISPLLANIVLNELDQWVESQWQNNPVGNKYAKIDKRDGSLIKSDGYDSMRNRTKLKEMFIVRYADDFRIFCRNKKDANRILIAVTKWLNERLKLQVSEEKTRVVNTRHQYMDFLGFKIKLHKRRKKYVVESHMSDKALSRSRKQLTDQAKRIARPKDERMRLNEVSRYNLMVMGKQNYYKVATHISQDARSLNRAVMTILTNRLKTRKHGMLAKKGRELTKTEKEYYGKSKMLRYLASTGEPIYPIGYVQHKFPIAKRNKTCFYSKEGRRGIHDNLEINTTLLHQLIFQQPSGRSTEYSDNRISLFSAQYGKCAVTGKAFENVQEIHCHHKKLRSKGGTDEYKNLTLVTDQVHKLIHAKDVNTVNYYLNLLKLDRTQLKKLNDLRKLAGSKEIQS